MKDKSTVSMAVFITAIEIKNSKRNSKKYALINFEDSTGVMEGIIFNDEIVRHEDKLEVGIPLLITGTIDNSDENLKIIVNSFNGNDAIKEIKNISLPLKIKIDREISDNETVKLKKLFEKYPGESNIEILLSNNGLKARIGIEDLKVHNCDELKKEISEFNFNSH